MRRFLLLFFLLFATLSSLRSQLPSGTLAPDFTATDLDGNVHVLSSYLNNGVSVVLDISATWCGPCWSYHHSGTLSNIYNNYGPSGTGEAMVFMIEGDPATNLACLYGPSGCTGGTQGNWVSGTPYPIVHNEGPSIANSYQISAYPTIFLISAANKKLYTNGGGGIPYNTIVNYLEYSFKMAVTSVNVTDAVCGGDGTIELTVDKGFGSLRYQWSNGATTKNLNNLDPGVYSCTITDLNNHDIETGPITVGGVFQPLSLDPGIYSPLKCNGDNDGSVAVWAYYGNGGYTYQWDDGQTDFIKLNCTAGDHYVTVTDAAGCQVEEVIYLPEPDLLQANVEHDVVPCGQSQGSATITALGGTLPYTYDIGNGTQQSGVFNNLNPGVYQYTVLDKNSCSYASSFEIQAIGGPHAEAAAQDSLTCVVSQTTVSGAGSSTGDNITYQWTTTDGHIVSGANDINAVVNAAGTYLLTVADTLNNCESVAQVTVLSFTNTPNIAVAPANQITCNDSTSTVSATLDGDPADFNIQWTTNDGHIVSGATSLNAVVDTAGSYFIAVTSNINGCSSYDTVAVTEYFNIPSGNFQYTLVDDVFSGTASSSSPTHTYLWDFGNGQTSTEKDPVVTLGEGLFNVCLTVTNECGSDQKCQTINNSSVLTASITSNNISCFGLNNGTASVSVSGGIAPYTYLWTGPDGYTSTESTISNLASGTYTVTITDSQNETVVQSVTISEPTQIVLSSVNIINDSENSGVGAISVDVSGGTGALQYLWSNGEKTQNIKDLVAGTYNCTVTDENGCQKQFGPFIVENTTSVNEAAYIDHLNIYPNPVSTDVFIDAKLVNKGNVSIELTNSIGEILMTQHFTDKVHTNWDVSSLSGGVYLISIKGKDFTVSRRLMVIR